MKRTASSASALGRWQLSAGAAVAPDSSTIDGPDCGHAKQIIGKWQKAARAPRARARRQHPLSR
eukprot:7273119-Alexandrium_andersonii.AAC.1